MSTANRDERVAYQRAVRADWKSLQFEPEEVIEIGADHLVSTGRMKGVGRGSGATVDTFWTVIFQIEDGRVRREQIITDRDEALQAIRLLESQK